MNPEYFSLTFDTKGYNNEILMAMLGVYPLESFHEDGDTLIAYILKHDITKELLIAVQEAEGKWFESFQMDLVPHQNWNEVWESSFNPIPVNDYCYIRAEFHKAPENKFKHEIIIAPKMAFGTGHHATTYMMIEAMARIDFSGKTVFDFGCGTGILSVLAAKEGAQTVVGVDTQPESKENSDEHAKLNQVGGQCTFYEGGIELVRDQKFDIILANINLHVIQEYFEDLKRMLNPGGVILLSGIMIYDKAKVEETITFEPFTSVEQNERGEWIQITVR